MMNEQVKPNGEAKEVMTRVPQKAEPAQPGEWNPRAEALPDLAKRMETDELVLREASNNRTRALAFGIPLFAISLAVIAGKAPQIYHVIGLTLNSKTVELLILGVLDALIVVPFYYFIFHKQVVQAGEAFDRSEQAYITARLSTMDGRKEFFREQLFKLSSKASQVFFGDEKRFAKASVFATTAGRMLDDAQSTADLGIVQTHLNSLSELVSREEREQRDERRWQYVAIAIIVIYVGALVYFARIDFGAEKPQHLFGVPVSVLLWGAAGSLAAILYRFYTEQGRIRFSTEFRWLIARPIIGIIMGGVVYIGLTSGLVLLTTAGNNAAAAGGAAAGGAAASGAAAAAMHNEAFWIVAFLAGFSDKFYLGVIDLLVARTVRTEEVNKNTVITKSERVPENKAGEPHAADAAGGAAGAAAGAVAGGAADGAAPPASDLLNEVLPAKA